MYQFSRSIYRELAPRISDGGNTSNAESNHLRVLRACEQSIERLMIDRRYFAYPTRTLFNDIRAFFSMADQELVYSVVDKHVSVADEYFAQLPDAVYTANGTPRRCHAMTRKSTACARTPLPSSDYCPSHQHLNETFEELEPAAPLAA